jgi:hypothetical protein
MKSDIYNVTFRIEQDAENAMQVMRVAMCHEQ